MHAESSFTDAPAQYVSLLEEELGPAEGDRLELHVVDTCPGHCFRQLQYKGRAVYTNLHLPGAGWHWCPNHLPLTGVLQQVFPRRQPATRRRRCRLHRPQRHKSGHAQHTGRAGSGGGGQGRLAYAGLAVTGLIDAPVVAGLVIAGLAVDRVTTRHPLNQQSLD